MIAVVFALVLAAPPPQLAVLDVKPRFEVPPELAAGLTDVLLTEVQRLHPGLGVIGMDEIRSLLALQKQKQMLGCNSVSCLAEIGGSLGARRLVSGSLSRFNDIYVISLQLIEVRNARILQNVSQQVSGKAKDLLPAATSLVDQLFPDELRAITPTAVPSAATAQAVETTASPDHSHLLSWLLFGGAAVGAGLAVTGAIVGANYAQERRNLQSGTNGAPLKNVQGDLSTANNWATGGIIAGSLALAAIVGGVVTW